MDKWIVEYIRRNYQVSATDQPFHEAFFAEFGGKRKEIYLGAQVVYKVQRRLKRLWEKDVLERHICKLSMGLEFPKWVYIYRIRELEQGWEIQI